MKRIKVTKREETLGGYLRFKRESERLRLSDLAEKTGINEGRLSKIENNKILPSLRETVTLFNHYNLSLDIIKQFIK